MPARSTRQEARERIIAALRAQVDQMIPLDESIPLKGSTFADFEDQVETLARGALPVVLEERAALEPNAAATAAGCCPHCGSLRTRLKKELARSKLISPHGAVAAPRQQARCKDCGGSFSPSGA